MATESRQTGPMTTTALPARPPAAVLVAWLFALGGIATGLLAVAHAGVELPLISALGPGGDRAVPVAVAVFTAGAVLMLALAAGAFARARWVLPVGALVALLVVVEGFRNYRGVASAAGIALGLLLLLLLLSPGGRHAFGRRS